MAREPHFPSRAADQRMLSAKFETPEFSRIHRKIVRHEARLRATGEYAARLAKDRARWRRGMAPLIAIMSIVMYGLYVFVAPMLALDPWQPLPLAVIATALGWAVTYPSD